MTKKTVSQVDTKARRAIIARIVSSLLDGDDLAPTNGARVDDPSGDARAAVTQIFKGLKAKDAANSPA